MTNRVDFKLGPAGTQRRYFEPTETLTLSKELVEQLAEDYERAAWDAATSARAYAAYVTEDDRLTAIWSEAVALTVERLIATLMHGTAWVEAGEYGQVSTLPKRPNFQVRK